MLIELSNDVGSIVSATALEPNAIDGLEHLLCCHREGRHVVAVSHMVARALADCRELSSRARGTAAHLYRTASELLGLRNQVRSRMIVDTGLLGPSVESSVPLVLRTTLSWWADTAHSRECILLTENLDDALVYERLAEAVMRRRKMFCRMSVRRQGGGGTTIAKELSEIVRRGEICVCVVDSDRRYPGGGLGAVASQALVSVR